MLLKRHRFFTNLLQMVLNCKRDSLSQEEAASFSNSVAFYNYPPVLVDGRHRRPTDDMFRAGAEPLQTVLKALEASAVLVCGDRLWRWLAPTLDGMKGDPWDYAYFDDGQRIFGRIHHPGMAFSSDRWAPRGASPD